MGSFTANDRLVVAQAFGHVNVVALHPIQTLNFYKLRPQTEQIQRSLTYAIPGLHVCTMNGERYIF